MPDFKHPKERMTGLCCRTAEAVALLRRSPFAVGTSGGFGVGDHEHCRDRSWCLDYVGKLKHLWRRTKKADVVEHSKAFDHVGLLFSEPPGTAELPFV